MNLSIIKNILKNDVKNTEKETNADKEDYFLEREVEKMKKNWTIINFIEKLDLEEALFQENNNELKCETSFNKENTKEIKVSKVSKDVKDIRNLRGILFS